MSPKQNTIKNIIMIPPNKYQRQPSKNLLPRNCTQPRAPDGTQITKHGGKFLYPLSHLAGLEILKCDKLCQPRYKNLSVPSSNTNRKLPVKDSTVSYKFQSKRLYKRKLNKSITNRITP